MSIPFFYFGYYYAISINLYVYLGAFIPSKII